MKAIAVGLYVNGYPHKNNKEFMEKAKRIPYGVSDVEGLARRLNVPYTEVYERMSRTGVIEKL